MSQQNCFQRAWASPNRNACLIVAAIVATVMISVMVPISYYGVEYNQYGLSRNKLTNKIDYSTIYVNGNYYLGLGYEMINFPRNYQYEYFSNNQLSVFSREGLEFFIQCSFQWRPLRSAIPEIHRQFRLAYRVQVINRVISTIKNTAIQFNIDQFVVNRTYIDSLITGNIAFAVASIGFEIPIDKFQFDKPLFPDTVRNRYLQTQVQLVKNEEQTLRQQQAIVEQETTLLVSNINSNASRLLSEATSTSNRIMSEAKSNAFNIINIAEQEGLNSLFIGMSITNSTTKKLLQKIIAIERSSGLTIYFDLNPGSVNYQL